MYDYQILCFTFLIFSGIFGILFNTIFIGVTIRQSELRKIYAFFLCSVSFMNLLYSASNATLQPFVLIFNVKSNSTYCSVVGMVTSVTGLGSSFNQSFVALNRFVAMYYAQQQSKIFSRRNNIFMVSFTFVLAVLVSCVLYHFGDLGFLGNTVCGPDVESMNFVHILFFMAPLCVSNGICVYSGFKIWRLIKSHQQNTTHLTGSRLQHAKDIVILILIELVVPTMLETPLLLFCLLSDYIQIPKFLLSASVCLFITHPVMDPVIIVIVVKPYRTTFAKLWKDLLRQNMVTKVEPVAITNFISINVTAASPPHAD